MPIVPTSVQPDYADVFLLPKHNDDAAQHLPHNWKSVTISVLYLWGKR